MQHPMLTTPQGIQKVLKRVMSEEQNISQHRRDAMLSFFCQVSENYQTFATGLFFRENGGLVPAVYEVGRSLQDAVFVTECSLVDPLVLNFNDQFVTIDHKSVACFLEKPSDENPQEATRVYFNPVDEFFVAVGITYKGEEKPGPFAPGAQSEFFRIYPTPKEPDQIYETMIQLLNRTFEIPEDLLQVYRPVH